MELTKEEVNMMGSGDSKKIASCKRSQVSLVLLVDLQDQHIRTLYANLDCYFRPCRKFFSCEVARSGRPRKALPSKKLV